MYGVDFGHIPSRLDLCFDGGQVRTLDPHDPDWMASVAHPDGYVYPPIVRTVTESPSGSPEPVPNSERGSLLHRFPATHTLVLFDGERENDAALRDGVAGFCIHFLGFVCGHRTQFSDWWIDGRVPVSPVTDAPPIYPREVGTALELALGGWTRMAKAEQRVVTNAFFMHNRVPVYEWPWERFMVEYQVFDAMFRVANRTDGVTGRGHSARLAAVADHYGLLRDDERFKKIATLRNQLFHETLWAGGMPTAGGGEDGYYSSIWLKGINQRLGMALLGFTGPYIASSWYSLIQGFLDLDQLKWDSWKHATQA
jgi:hypothetical protein